MSEPSAFDCVALCSEARPSGVSCCLELFANPFRIFGTGAEKETVPHFCVLNACFLGILHRLQYLATESSLTVPGNISMLISIKSFFGAS